MKILIAASALIIAAGASPVVGLAQQQLESKSSGQSEQIEQQFAAFERVLRGAIDAAAARLNQRVSQALPNRPTALVYQRDAIVTGVPMPDGGAVFHLLIPAIEAIDLRIAILQRDMARQKPMGTPTRTVGSAVVDPDPSAAAAAPAGPPLTDPDKEYSQLTRAAIIDAMLDGALALPIPEDKHLTVLADELQTDPPGPFNPRSRTLILQIKGEDLLALRQNKITREEAKARIKETKFPN